MQQQALPPANPLQPHLLLLPHWFLPQKRCGCAIMRCNKFCAVRVLPRPANLRSGALLLYDPNDNAVSECVVCRPTFRRDS